MKHALLAGAFAVIGSVCSLSQAQTPGSVDTTFNAASLDSYVNSVLAAPGGKVIVGGLFTHAGDATRNHVARLNADGSLDTTFDPGAATGVQTGAVDKLVLQPDGKILAGGHFTMTDDHSLRDNLARLKPNGSLDMSFNPAVPFEVLGLALQADGKILASGPVFQTSPSISYYLHIVRLNADGSPDGSFNFTPVPTKLMGGTALAVQSDGKIVLGANFQTIGGVARENIARLNADGTLDAGFNPGSGVTYSRGTSYVTSVVIAPDGKLFIGGNFDAVNGVAEKEFARLNADGTLDAGFTAAVKFNNTVFAVLLQGDGKVFVGGAFNQDQSNQAVLPNLVRLNADGTLDTTFASGRSGLGTNVYSLALQADNKVLVGGTDSIYVFRLNGGPAPVHPAFFSGETSLGSGVYYLQFASGTPFGYYSYLADPHYIYHFDLGYEYVFDAADGKGGVNFYDFASQSFFYTSPGFPFPYLYDFSLNTVLYYYADSSQAGHYTTNPRYFYNFGTGQIITK